MTDEQFRREALKIETRAEKDALIERCMKENDWPDTATGLAIDLIRAEASDDARVY